MAQTLLPSVNFNSNPGLDEFDFLHQTYSTEFAARTQIGSIYGIVDQDADPARAPFSSGRPLAVSISPVNPLTIDVSPGSAITPNYMWISIDATVPGIPLPGTAAGKVYVVAVEYVLIPNSSTRVSRYGVPVNTRLFRPSNTPPDGTASTLIESVVIAELNDWNNPTLYSSDRKNGIVVVAVVTILSDPATGQLTLGIDSTNVTYAFNRPWFSPVDIMHRSSVGSGIVSSRNPHGTELQDLSSAGFTLYQQLRERGGVIAKDSIYYGYPGKFCTEEITLNRFEADYRGTITTPEGMPPLGGSFYFRTVNLPIRAGSLYFTGEPWNPIPYTWIDGTRTVIVGALEDPSYYSKSLTFEYFSVSALEVGPEHPTQGVQTLTFGSPTEGTEFIVSAGLALNSLAQTSLSLPSSLGPIKKKYQVLCNGNGAFVLAPQPILTSSKITDIAANEQTINQAPSGGVAARLIVGLTRATERSIIGATAYDLNAQIRITGTSATGAVLQEIVVFKASQWKDQTAADVEEPMQFVVTKNKFQQISKIAVINTSSDPHNAGPDALVSIWADVLSTSANQELAKVASFFWNGSTGIQLKDERIISTTLQLDNQKSPRMPAAVPENDFALVPEAFSALLTPPLVTSPVKRLMIELDDDRYWGETWKDFSTTDASASLQLRDFGDAQPGILIRVSDGKFLRLVASNANSSNGDVLIGGTSAVLLNNMIAALNDPSFDSSWAATLGTGDVPPVLTARQTAYPEGFAPNFRKLIKLTTALATGHTIVVRINGVPFTASFTSSSSATLTALVASINANASLIGGISATMPIQGYSNSFIINGTSDFKDFVVSCSISGVLPPVALITNAPDAFTLNSPVGGILPLDHLPQRYLDKHTNWVYQSRPLLWEGVGLVGSIGWINNSTATVINNDKIEVAQGRILTARRGAVSVDKTAGEFLVDPASLTNTIDSAISTINNPTWNTGIFASVKSAEVKSLAVNIDSDTISFPKHGFSSGESVLFTGLPAFSFSPTDVDTGNDLINHAGHGLDDGQIINFATTIVLPTGLNTTDQFYIVSSTDNTFKVATTSGGLPINFTDGGSGTHSVIALPNELHNTQLHVTNVTVDSFQLADSSETLVDITTQGAGSFRMSGTVVLLRSNGLANAVLSKVSEGVDGTWLLTPFSSVGSGDRSSHAIVKTVKPLMNAEWRFKTIEQSGNWIQSSGTTTVTMENGHGMSDGVSINVLGMRANIISVLSSPPSSPLIGDTYLIGDSASGVWAGKEGWYARWSGSLWAMFLLPTGNETITVINPYQFSFNDTNFVFPDSSGTIEYVAQQMGWSAWLPLAPISPSAYKFDGPMGKSLYCVQLRLTGEAGSANGFSVYQYTPEVAHTTLADLQTRLTAVEAEILAARGSFTNGTLTQRLDVGITANGILVKDTELVEALDSTTADSVNSLKNRLDFTDAMSWWKTGGSANMLNPMAMNYPGQYENAIVRGPVDGDGNSAFMNASSNILQLVPAVTSTPLVFAIQGHSFVFSRQDSLSFTGLPAGTYYVYADTAGMTAGRELVTNTLTTNWTSGTSVLYHTSALFTNVVTSGVGQSVLAIPSVTVNGQPFYSPIVAVAPDFKSVTIAGKIPSMAVSGAPFTVYAPHEIQLQTVIAASKPATTPATRLYLGEVTWSGTLLSNIVSYRYLGRYTSPLVPVTAAPNYTAQVFNHNLGYLPRNFVIYFYLTGTDTVPNKVLHIGDEAVVTADKLTLSVKNRYSNQVAKNWAGTVLADGWLQVVI